MRSAIGDPAGNVNHFRFTGTNLAAVNRDTIFQVDPRRPMFARYRIVTIPPAAPAAPATPRATP